jgi:hypothetical protein
MLDVKIESCEKLTIDIDETKYHHSDALLVVCIL